MNHDDPATPVAQCDRTADLEQQLRLADEGASRLAARCLALEQQVLNYEAKLAAHTSGSEAAGLHLPQLFYDSGAGFSPRECLTVSEDAYDELTHEVSAVFELPADARALRLDPGELACCLTGLEISDERIRFRPTNGLTLQEDCLLFLDADPNLTLECATGFSKGMKFAVTYQYYPLGHFLHEQPGKALLDTLDILKKQKQEIELAYAGQLQQTEAEVQRLRTELETNRLAYEASLESMTHSSSWRLTAPLRALRSLFRGGRGA